MRRDVTGHAGPGATALAGFIAGVTVACLVVVASARFDAWTETHEVYGTPPDYTTPWSPAGCRRLAVDVALGAIVREAGGRKSAYMRKVGEPMDPEAPETQKALAELSTAWDRAESGAAFYRRCIQTLLDHQAKPEGKPS